MKRVAVPVLVSVAAVAIVVAAPGASSTHTMEPVQRSAYVMGTRIDLMVWGTGRDEGLADLNRALAVVEATDEQLSTWRADSRLTAINGAPLDQPLTVDADTCAVLGDVFRWSRETGGAFDPAVGALIEAWGLRDAHQWPSPGLLADARKRSGLRHLDLEMVTCVLTKRRAVLLDAGAFGKGVALDRAARVLKGRRWQIDFGGQVAVGGAPSTEYGWPVALAHPRERQHAVLTVSLKDGSLATSGGSERDVTVNGRRVGHILDPRTGAPASFDGSVAVWHPDAFVADILSTALFVMGRDAGLIWAGQRGLAACFLEAGSDGTVAVRTTEAFSALVGGVRVHPRIHGLALVKRR